MVKLVNTRVFDIRIRWFESNCLSQIYWIKKGEKQEMHGYKSKGVKNGAMGKATGRIEPEMGGIQGI